MSPSRNLRMRALALYASRLRRSRLRAVFHERIAGRVAGLSPGKWIIDVGCGPGLLGARISSMIPRSRIVGVDMDPRMALIARDGTKVDVIVATSTALPFRSRSVDVAVSSASLKDWGDRIGGLREVQRVLKAEGTGLVFEFVTIGPEAEPDGFRLRYGFLSDLLRRLARYVIPFSLGDASRLAKLVGGELRAEPDLGVIEIRLRPI